MLLQTYISFKSNLNEIKYRCSIAVSVFLNMFALTYQFNVVLYHILRYHLIPMSSIYKPLFPVFAVPVPFTFSKVF